MRENRNILIIDQATQNTSYVIVMVRNGVPYWTMCSKLEVGDNPNYKERILEVYNKLSVLIDEYTIDTVVIEDVPPMFRNFHSLSVLLKLMGVIEILCLQKRIDCDIMNINHWKSVAGIKGKGRIKQKQESIKLALDRWVAYKDLIIKSDDVADALNISYAYLIDEGYIKKSK